MCFAVNQENKKIIDQQLQLWPDGEIEIIGWAPRRWISAFDFPLMPIVLFEDGKPRVDGANWGLVPHWIKDDEGQKAIRVQTLNARVETIFTKPSFKASAHSRRCLIPVNGFYEYQHLDKEGRPDPAGKKTKPYRLYLRDKPVFYLGGLWALWRGTRTFSIVTMEANALMRQIHNTKSRMPLIIPAGWEEPWLRGGPEEEIRPLMLPCDDDGLEAEETAGKKD